MMFMFMVDGEGFWGALGRSSWIMDTERGAVLFNW